jgi:hypothetical protein
MLLVERPGGQQSTNGVEGVPEHVGKVPDDP